MCAGRWRASVSAIVVLGRQLNIVLALLWSIARYISINEKAEGSPSSA